MNSRPNIVIVNADQWRGDVLGHLGNPAASTPVLDAWTAADAVSFRNAFCQAPVCTPSRCSFMTGWYPHTRGHRTMYHMLRAGEPSILLRLKEAGYHVWWGGKNDLVPAQHGSAEHCTVRYVAGPEEVDSATAHLEYDYSFYVGRLQTSAGRDHYPDVDWANVLAAVDAIHNAPSDRPLCLFLALDYPHPEYAVEDPWYSAIDRTALPARTPSPPDWAGKPSILAGIHQRQGLADRTEEQWTDLRATYYGMCARVDHQFGLILNALRRAGSYDNTAVFFFSDHGDFTGDYGLVEKTQNTFEDCLTRVPLLIKPPASFTVRPGVSEALVELIDVPATIEALTGTAAPYSHFGRSLLPIISGTTDHHRDAVFCEGGRLAGETHCMEWESPGSRDPNNPYWPRVSLQVGSGPKHTKAAMCRTHDFKYVHRLYESDELYDLLADPKELQNRIADPTLTGERIRLHDRMLRWYQETCDVVPHDTDRRGY